MSKTVPSHAEFKMIRWCRERARASIPEVAEKLLLSETDINLWEFGDDQPTLTQLKALAKYLRFPTAIFYLKEPPKWHPVKDCRRLPDSIKGNYSRELAYWTRIVQGRSEWLAEYFMSQRRKPLTLVGSAKLTESPIDVGKRLRAFLGVGLDSQTAIRNKDAAFRMWRLQCESLGVSVCLTRRIALDEMRGFAVSQPLAPIIAINDQDRPGGRIFSLMHEMAHVMLNVSGVSERVYDEPVRNADEKTEVFCNAVSAEVLVPSDDFRERISKFDDNYDDSIQLLADSYSVSREVIARRLLDHGLIARDHFHRIIAGLREGAVTKKGSKKKVIRIKQAKKVLSTVGRTLGRAVVSAYYDDEITGPEVCDLLDMKIQFLPEFEKQLSGK